MPLALMLILKKRRILSSFLASEYCSHKIGGSKRPEAFLVLVLRLDPAEAGGHEDEPKKNDEPGKAGCFPCFHGDHMAHGDEPAGVERVTRFIAYVQADRHHDQPHPDGTSRASFGVRRGIHAW